jgi:hypothetical protein
MRRQDLVLSTHHRIRFKQYGKRTARRSRNQCARHGLKLIIGKEMIGSSDNNRSEKQG